MSWISLKNSLRGRLIISPFSVSVVVNLVALSLSFILMREVSILRGDLEKLKGDILFHLNWSTSTDFPGGRRNHLTWERDPLTTSFSREKRELAKHAVQRSLLQLIATANEELVHQDDVTVIPWAVSIMDGDAVSLKANKVIVQKDGYYMVFSQVLFHNSDTVMGYLIQRRKSNVSGLEQRFTDLLRCLQDMPKNRSANSCYTAGVVKLEHEDELELVILDRPQAQVAMEADSTFFGIIRLP